MACAIYEAVSKQQNDGATVSLLLLQWPCVYSSVTNVAVCKVSSKVCSKKCRVCCVFKLHVQEVRLCESCNVSVLPYDKATRAM